MRSRRSRPNIEKQPNEAPDIRAKITGMLDLPQSALVGITQMELSGNREVVVDGCLGVLAYEEGLIKLALRGMIATFRGRNLQIKALTHDSAIVCGFLTGIDFAA